MLEVQPEDDVQSFVLKEGCGGSLSSEYGALQLLSEYGALQCESGAVQRDAPLLNALPPGKPLMCPAHLHHLRREQPNTRLIVNLDFFHKSTLNPSTSDVENRHLRPEPETGRGRP